MYRIRWQVREPHSIVDVWLTDVVLEGRGGERMVGAGKGKEILRSYFAAEGQLRKVVKLTQVLRETSFVGSALSLTKYSNFRFKTPRKQLSGAERAMETLPAIVKSI